MQNLTFSNNTKLNLTHYRYKLNITRSEIEFGFIQFANFANLPIIWCKFYLQRSNLTLLSERPIYLSEGCYSYLINKLPLIISTIPKLSIGAKRNLSKKEAELFKESV